MTKIAMIALLETVIECLDDEHEFLIDKINEVIKALEEEIKYEIK